MLAKVLMIRGIAFENYSLDAFLSAKKLPTGREFIRVV